MHLESPAAASAEAFAHAGADTLPAHMLKRRPAGALMRWPVGVLKRCRHGLLRRLRAGRDGWGFRRGRDVDDCTDATHGGRLYAVM